MNKLVRSPNLAAALFAVSLCLPASSPLAGQDPTILREPPSGSDFQPGQLIRLTAPGLVIDEGLIESIDGNSLVVSSQGQQWSVDTGSLEEVSVQRRLTRRYAIVGFFPGAFVGAVGELFVNKVRDCGGQGCGDAAIGRSALIGGAAGMALGAIVGATTTRWRQIFP